MSIYGFVRCPFGYVALSIWDEARVRRLLTKHRVILIDELPPTLPSDMRTEFHFDALAYAVWLA